MLPRKSQSLILPFPKKLTVKSSPWGRHLKTILIPGGGGGQEIKQANLQNFKCQGRRDVDLSFELIDI